MATPPASPRNEDELFLQRSVDAAVRIAIVAALVVGSWLILRPFVATILGAAVIAVAVFPAYRELTVRLGGRRKATAVLLVVAALAGLLVPAAVFLGSTIESISELGKQMDAGTLKIPPPPPSVAGWPLVGEPLAAFWTQASTNLTGLLASYEAPVRVIGEWLLSFGAGLGVGLLQFILSIVIAGAFLAAAETAGNATGRVARRFTAAHGAALVELTGKTIRSVALGVVGVAMIQGAAAGLGMLAVGVPHAALLALLVLVCAVIQLPPLLVLAPVVVYLFSTAPTVTAVVFTIWAILVSSSDTVLKPLLMGRGLDVPMLVILLGAIGGMMLLGIIGLFVGAVFLAVAYRVFMAWLGDDLVPA